MWDTEIETTSLTHARRMSPRLRQRFEKLRERHIMRAQVDAWQAKEDIATLPSLGVLDRRATALDVCNRRLVGLACRYGVVYFDDGDPEMVMPGAFEETIVKNRNIIALVNHEIDRPGDIVARARDQTLHIWESTDGLRCSIRVPDTRVGREVLRCADNGEIAGMSIGLRPTETRNVHLSDALTDKGESIGNVDVRCIRRAHLGEITIVLKPLNPMNKATWCRRLRPGDPLVEVIARRDQLARLVA